jgi:hypothetical protein
MSDKVLRKIQAIIQRDVNTRGLATVPDDNLFTACIDGFQDACLSLATLHGHLDGLIVIVTGFYIPSAGAAETDGPLGAFFLARLLARLGCKVLLLSENWCYPALAIALAKTKSGRAATNPAQYMSSVAAKTDPPPILIGRLPVPADPGSREAILTAMRSSAVTHLIAIERVGPSHQLESFQLQKRKGPPNLEAFKSLVPAENWDQCHTMRGQIITDKMFPAHRAFEKSFQSGRPTTIGIGDGGNEIGMGKIPWETIAKNVPNGGLVACRVPTAYNIVCGVSNWGVYGLAAGVWHLRGMPFDEELFSADRERELWEKVLREAVLVDGVTGERTLTVDGLSWDDYIQPLREIAAILKESS